MTDKEIIKALDDCLTKDKVELYFISTDNKIASLKIADILDLINRQQAEIERLKVEIEREKQIWKSSCEYYKHELYLLRNKNKGDNND